MNEISTIHPYIPIIFSKCFYTLFIHVGYEDEVDKSRIQYVDV